MRQGHQIGKQALVSGFCWNNTLFRLFLMTNGT
jgi:hypothetical protein